MHRGKLCGRAGIRRVEFGTCMLRELKDLWPMKACVSDMIAAKQFIRPLAYEPGRRTLQHEDINATSASRRSALTLGFKCSSC